jgi:hypothetical protein
MAIRYEGSAFAFRQGGDPKQKTRLHKKARSMIAHIKCR